MNAIQLRNMLNAVKDTAELSVLVYADKKACATAPAAIGRRHPDGTALQIVINLDAEAIARLYLATHTVEVPPFLRRNKGEDNILEEANSLVHGDRGEDYGHPINDFTCSAKLLSAYLSRRMQQTINITAEDIPMMQILIKASREAHKHKKDNLVDIAGYAETKQMVHNVQANREKDWAPPL